MEILYSNNLPKVIHTWSSDAPIWKEEAYVQMASALSVLRHYGYIHFYGDNKAFDEVKSIGIPYSTYESIQKQEFDQTFAVPKLQVYEKFDNTRDYIHLDTDTILFRKLDFSNFKSPFVFSHCDKYISPEQRASGEFMNKFISSTKDPTREENFYSQLYLIYLKPFFDLKNQIPTQIIKATDVWSIPNMNTVYVKKGHGEMFAKASSFVFDLYKRNKQLIDSQENGSCFLEQFLIHQHLRSSHSLYKDESTKLEHLLKHRNPLNQLGFHRTTLADTTFPVEYTYQHPRCTGCNDIGPTGTFQINSREDVRKLFDMDFGESIHFSHLLWYEWWQCYVINHIVKNYGAEYVKRVHNHYNRGGSVKLSAGEKLYEQITGHKIFTK